MRVLKTLCCAIALGALLAPGARADEWNKLTYLTFSAPVQLPGVTLPAGTYTFKLADTWSNRHIVQVFDKDQTKIYGTFLTVSDQRLRPADKPLVMFNEAPAGQPVAVKAWFYPGDIIGDEFVYTKNQAVNIAKANHEPVMAINDDNATGNDVSTMKNAKVGHVDENGKMTEDTEDNRAMNEPATTTTQGTNAQATTGTTSENSRPAGLYTGAPDPANHRTGVAENSDTMNRYDQRPTEQAANTTAGGSTTVREGTTQAEKQSAQATTGTSGTTGTTAATGTTGQSGTATGTTAQAGSGTQAGSASTGTTAATGTAATTGTTAANGTTAKAGGPARHSRSAVGTSGQANRGNANADNNNNKRRLPRTASSLALVELLSGLSIAAAFGVRQLRKRVVDAR